MKPRFVKAALAVIFVFASSVVLYGEKEDDSQWVPMEERIKIWDRVVSRELFLPMPLQKPKPYVVSADGFEATFEKDRARWTIIGANAPIVNPTVYQKDWPVKGDDFEVLVIPEPISNYRILPFTENIENAVKSDTIRITAARDSYEPASFVIRSGDLDLKDVMVEVTDLEAKIDSSGKKQISVIPKENIDVRVVKCWYQAGVALNDTNHKLLTPELLVHDDNLVNVDYETQVNLLRNFDRIEDSAQLQMFTIPRRQNKQVWLTAYFETNTAPGTYSGTVKIKKKGVLQKELQFEIEVLPFILPEPMLEYALYYEGRLSDSETTLIEAGRKTERQMGAELENMKAHGLTNATVWHRVNADKTKWTEDWDRLRKTLGIRKEIGWNNRPLLYLDWKVSFREDREAYKEKIEKILDIARKEGIKDVYIYGVDEKGGKELSDLNDLYEQVQKMGAKTFVAGCIGQFLQFACKTLDMFVAAGPVKDVAPKGEYAGATPEQIKEAKNQDKKVLIYGNPQAGREEPATYRRNYGFELFRIGADGTLNYAYQTGRCWNDFNNIPYRYHVMAYPTTGRPISTVQWEGWREGVTDIRYLTLLKNENMLSDDFFKACYEGGSEICRKKIIETLVDRKK